MGTYNIDLNGAISAAYKELSAEVSADQELSSLLDVKEDLETISNAHDGFLAGMLGNFDPNGTGFAGDFKLTNTEYDKLVNSLQVAASHGYVDTDGGVSGSPALAGSVSGGSSGGGYAGGSGYDGSSAGGGGSFTSGTGSPSLESLNEVSPGTGQPSINPGENPQRREVSPESPTTTSPDNPGGSGTTPGTTNPGTTTPVTTSPGGAALGAAGVVGGTTVGAALGDVGGLGGAESVGALSPVNYAMGNYAVSDNFSESFTDNEKISITNILEENGYSKEEIAAILNGEYSSPKVLMDSMADTLSEVVKNNPDLRDKIINQYGFDIFNADGSVNSDKLSMALYIDDMSGKDSYSLISLLSNQYGTHLVDQTALNSYASQFETLVLKDYGIKGRIIDQYGFDIFNIDGTVNKDRLTLAMLIDAKRKNGSSLTSLINDSVASDITSYLNTNIRSTNGTPSRGDRSKFTPVAAVLAAGGAAAGIGIVSHNKREKEKEKPSENEENESIEVVKEENNDWVTKMLEEENNI